MVQLPNGDAYIDLSIHLIDTTQEVKCMRLRCSTLTQRHVITALKVRPTEIEVLGCCLRLKNRFHRDEMAAGR